MREREREIGWLIDLLYPRVKLENSLLICPCECTSCTSYVIAAKCVTSNYIFHVFISISWQVVSLKVYSGWCWFSSADTGQWTECDTTGDSSGGRHQEFWGSDRLVLCVVLLTMWTWHVVACTHVCAFTHFHFLSLLPPPPNLLFSLSSPLPHPPNLLFSLSSPLPTPNLLFSHVCNSKVMLFFYVCKFTLFLQFL